MLQCINISTQIYKSKLTYASLIIEIKKYTICLKKVNLIANNLFILFCTDHEVTVSVIIIK